LPRLPDNYHHALGNIQTVIFHDKPVVAIRIAAHELHRADVGRLRVFGPADQSASAVSDTLSEIVLCADTAPAQSASAATVISFLMLIFVSLSKFALAGEMV